MYGSAWGPLAKDERGKRRTARPWPACGGLGRGVQRARGGFSCRDGGSGVARASRFRLEGLGRERAGGETYGAIMLARNADAARAGINVRYNAEAKAITGAEGDFTITLAKGDPIRAETVVLAIGTQGNPNLKPEVSKEVELSTDVEVLNKYGLTVTYANSTTKNQILPTPASVSTGFPSQWQNAGSLQNKTWEGTLTLPFIQHNDYSWTTRFTYSSNRAVVTKLNVPPFFIGTDLQGTGSLFRIEEGGRYGTFYGRQFATSCAQLPATFQSQCGTSTSAFQKNDEGYLVATGDFADPIGPASWELGGNT